MIQDFLVVFFVDSRLLIVVWSNRLCGCICVWTATHLSDDLLDIMEPLHDDDDDDGGGEGSVVGVVMTEEVNKYEAYKRTMRLMTTWVLISNLLVVGALFVSLMRRFFDLGAVYNHVVFMVLCAVMLFNIIIHVIKLCLVLTASKRPHSDVMA